MNRLQDTLASLGCAHCALTPRAMLLSLAAQRGVREALDLAAWMAAQYSALAQNAPGRFPARPSFFPPAAETMTDDEIKARVSQFALRRDQQQ